MISITKTYDFFIEKIGWAIIGWLALFSPLLPIIGYKQAPGLLKAPLLLQVDSFPFYKSTCICVTGLIVSAFGIAVIRMFDLYASIRRNRSETAVQLHAPTDQRVTDLFWWNSNSTAWPLVFWPLWLLPTAILLWAMRDVTNLDFQRADRGSTIALSQYLFSILQGLLIASFALFSVSLAHAFISKNLISMCGLLPYEDQAMLVIESIFGKSKFNPNTRIAITRHWLMPGYLDGRTNKPLPGHIQMAVFMVFALVAFLILYRQSPTETEWKTNYLPVVSYALLLFFLAFGVLSWITFVLLRYRLSLVIMLPFFMLFYNWIGPSFHVDSNRYIRVIYPLDHPQRFVATDPNPSALANAGGKSNETESTFKRIIADISKQTRATVPPQRKRLKEIFDSEWDFPEDNGKKTLVVVTASGGGIQASAWTAQVLTRLDAICPIFSESIGLVSGVSGGSVGAMYYLGHRGYRRNSKGDVSPDSILRLTDSQKKRICQAARASSLETIAWGLTFPDAFKNIMPFQWKADSPHGNDHLFWDRGLALESSWWRKMGDRDDDWRYFKQLRMKDLIEPTNNGRMPPVIFNATAVETGQRVSIATFKTIGETSIKHPTEAPKDFETITTPIDFFDFFEPVCQDENRFDLRVSAAVRLSASFSYVTPVVTPFIPESEKNARKEFDSRLNYHLCDGGYADNTGLVSAIQVLMDLLDSYRNNNQPPPFQQILLLSIEAFPESKAQASEFQDKSGITSGTFGPLLAMINARVASQAERANLEKRLFHLAGKTTSTTQSKASSVQYQENPFWKEFGEACIELNSNLKTQEDSELSKREFEQLRQQLNYFVMQFEIDDSEGSDQVIRDLSEPKRMAGQYQEQWSSNDTKIADHLRRSFEKTTIAARKLTEWEQSAPPQTIAEHQTLTDSNEGYQPVEVHPVEIRFNLNTPPLSWELSPAELNNLDAQWNVFENKIIYMHKNKSVQPTMVSDASDPPNLSLEELWSALKSIDSTIKKP